MKWTNRGHELDFIGNQFKNRPRIYIYGAGLRGKECLRRLEFLNCVEGFIDKNKAKQERGFCDLPVYALSQICAFEKRNYLIIIASAPDAEGSITKSLLFSGFQPERDFYYMDSFLGTYLQIYAMYVHEKLMVHLYPQSITEKCTLNCLHCNHSLPYLKDPVHFTKEEFIADIDLFFSFVDHIFSADFVGGEPFTHPDFYEMMKYAAEHYRSRMDRMLFVTNGTITPSEDILQLMRDYDIKFWFSDYRTNAPHISRAVGKFLSCVKQSGVELLTNELEDWADYDLGNADIPFHSESEKIHYFDYCDTPCRYMRQGRLYYCTSDRLAQRAGLVPEDPDSYLDFKTMTLDRKMEILEFDLGFNKNGYLQTCTKCNGPFMFNVIRVPKGVQCQKENMESIQLRCKFPGISPR